MSTNTVEADASRQPLFEGFALVMLKPDQESRAREIAAQELGGDWRVRPFGDEGLTFEVTHAKVKRGALSTAEAWQKAYRLRTLPGVVNAEPIFAVPPASSEFEELIQQPPAEGEGTTGEGAPPGDIAFGSLFGGDNRDESQDPDWSLLQMKIFEAWEVYALKHGDIPPGNGVIVGHPDTGFTRHPEIIDHLLVDKGYDFEDDDNDAEDPLEGSQLLLQFPGHGTGTSSVIVSDRTTQSQYPGDSTGKAVKGIAPGARIIPLRISKSVVLWNGSTLNLARAIKFAADAGAHVISMSLGTGFPNPLLLNAITDAQRRGVIVCAAAGNYVKIVVWPAAYADVIAVSACNAVRLPWKHASRGSEVDVTAPGESVWCARSKRGDDGIETDVSRGSGTSYAVAAVAGIAALWLSYHGRDELAARYGEEKIPFIFNQILRQSCEQDEGWDSDRYGAGIVNAEKVLTAPLPDGVEHPVPSFSLPSAAQEPVGSGGILAHLFEETLMQSPGVSFSPGELPPDEKLRAALAKLLNTSEGEVELRLKEVGQELAFHLATSPELYELFEVALSTESGGVSFEPGAIAPVEGVRADLLSRGVSESLKMKLADEN